MEIEYLGHSSFLITTAGGVKILTDPYDTAKYQGTLMYSMFQGEVDIVTTSHSHPDHGAADIIKNKKMVVRECNEFNYQGICIKGIETAHDDSHGSARGKNIVFVIEADDLRIGHFGDLGHILTPEQQNKIGSIDVALLPVGGYYTISALQAHMVAKQIKAKIVIPMHYSTEKCNFPIDPVSEFVEGHKNVLVRGSSVLDVTKQSLSDYPQIVVLNYSM